MSAPAASRYLIALGSNVRHVRLGPPHAVLRAALAAMAARGLALERVSPIMASAPLGPSRRRYANAAAVVRSELEPPALLDVLHEIENAFGRVRRGARWGARTLDLDIVLWSGGCWHDDRLIVPHREYRRRAFVLAPAARIAPHWRDPLTGLTAKHLLARLTRRKPAPS
ncbi:MAG: 2-amino-4-hydroxy-6-hydroxymethyldihydropteridine diphosphokinase [Novosphingobium sp. 12-64-8]|nr:MAG: 2-amino-4-hydroxy-6-hydroxymethyldihydropteridine diphosphokinase [Novosphingobium sp. 12-64-8]